jgi:hypothetical protein
MMSVDRKSMRLWAEQSEQMSNLSLNLRKVYDKTKSRQPLFSEQEQELADWFLSRRDEHIEMNAHSMSNKMLELIREIPEIEKTEQMRQFVASRGWLERFMKRNNLVQRRVTGVGKGFPSNLKEIIELFLDDFHQKKKRKQLQ